MKEEKVKEVVSKKISQVYREEIRPNAQLQAGDKRE